MHWLVSITVVEPAANEGGKKRPFPPAQETLAEKKAEDFFRLTREGSPAAPKLVIDLTSPRVRKMRLLDPCRQ